MPWSKTIHQVKEHLTPWWRPSMMRRIWSIELLGVSILVESTGTALGLVEVMLCVCSMLLDCIYRNDVLLDHLAVQYIPTRPSSPSPLSFPSPPPPPPPTYTSPEIPPPPSTPPDPSQNTHNNPRSPPSSRPALRHRSHHAPVPRRGTHRLQSGRGH